MYGWGWGFDGQIGCVEKKLHSVPCKVVLPIDVKIARVSAGHSHSIAVDGKYHLCIV